MVIRILYAAVLALILSPAINSQPGGQEFPLSTLGGGSLSTASLQGRVIVLMFSGLQDPQCRDEFKALETLSERYQGRPVSVYWVSVNTPAEASDEKLRRPCGVATSITVLRLNDVNALKRISGRGASLPTLVVLNKQGQLFGQARSGFNPNTDFVNDLSQMIDSLLSK